MMEQGQRKIECDYNTLIFIEHYWVSSAVLLIVQYGMCKSSMMTINFDIGNSISKTVRCKTKTTSGLDVVSTIYGKQQNHPSRPFAA